MKWYNSHCDNMVFLIEQGKQGMRISLLGNVTTDYILEDASSASRLWCQFRATCLTPDASLSLSMCDHKD